MKVVLWGLLGQLAVAVVLYGLWTTACPRRGLNTVPPAELERLRRSHTRKVRALALLWVAANGALWSQWLVRLPADGVVVLATGGAASLALAGLIRSLVTLRRIARLAAPGALGTPREEDHPSPRPTTAQEAGLSTPLESAGHVPPPAAEEASAWVREGAGPRFTLECYEPRHEVIHTVDTPEPPPPLTFRPLREASVRIIGQAGALRRIEDDLRLACAGLTRRADRPFATFLLTGPTGVGKTETAHAIAEVLYGARERVARFSMNEAQGEGGNWRAFGPPPGYRDADQGGLLTNRIKRLGHRCVVLIDELEKGPSEVLDALLTGLDTGDFVEALSGTKVSVRDCIVIMTSNAIGPGEDFAGRTEDEVRDRLLQYRRRGQTVFSAEFLGRIKRVLWYRPLTDEDLATLCGERYRLFYAENVRRALGRNVAGLSADLARYLVGQLRENKGGVRSLDALIERTVVRAALEVRFHDERVDDTYRWDFVQEGRRAAIQLVRTGQVTRHPLGAAPLSGVSEAFH